MQETMPPLVGAGRFPLLLHLLAFFLCYALEKVLATGALCADERNVPGFNNFGGVTTFPRLREVLMLATVSLIAPFN